MFDASDPDFATDTLDPTGDCNIWLIERKRYSDFLGMQLIVGIKKRDDVSYGSIHTDITRRGQANVKVLPL